MRNRNMNNDKVVKAIALALSTVLASGTIAPAITAHAEELEPEAIETVIDEVVEEPVAVKTKRKYVRKNATNKVSVTNETEVKAKKEANII